MSDIIKVQQSELLSESKNIEHYRSVFNGAYGDIYAKVKELRNSYDGPDAVAFEEKIQGLRDDFEKMDDILSKYAKFLEKAYDTYHQAQENVKSRAGNLKSDL